MTALPRQLSPAHPHFKHWSARLVVYLDGAELRDMRGFNVGDGWVRVLERGADGKPQRAAGHLVEKIVQGRVEVGLRR
jgi:hypothetical protein